MKCKNKKHKKINIKSTTNKIKRKIFVVIRKNKKYKKIFKIKKRAIKKNKSYSELEEFNNIPNFSFCGFSPLNTKNNNMVETNQKEKEIKDIYDCDFNGIINIETNIRANNSVEAKNDTNFCD